MLSGSEAFRTIAENVHLGEDKKCLSELKKEKWLVNYVDNWFRLLKI
jgi:hypothetical protein